MIPPFTNRIYFIIFYNLSSVYLFLFFSKKKKKDHSTQRKEKSQKSLHVNNTFHHHQMVAWMERVNESNFNFLLTQASPPPLDTIRTRSFVSARRCMQRVCYQSSRRSSKTMRPRAFFSTLINSFTTKILSNCTNRFNWR